jgi:purine catabolism regulator
MLPLRSLLRELELEIAAGEAGLDRAVRWVHISELSDPTPWLSGGELLLTTGLAIGDDAEAYVSRLAEHGLTGLGFGVGFGHERIPEALLAAAAAHGFPLFEVPYELPFIAITEKAFSHLVNEQYAVLRRALAAHERLERVVLSERGLDGVAAELASLIGGPALIFDGRGELLARRGEAPLAELSAEMRERVRAGARRAYVPGALTPGALALPVARAAQPNRYRGPSRSWAMVTGSRVEAADVRGLRNQHGRRG